jgi:hypothetical protein
LIRLLEPVCYIYFRAWLLYFWIYEVVLSLSSNRWKEQRQELAWHRAKTRYSTKFQHWLQ